MVAVGYHWTNNGVLGEVPADLVPEGSPPSACRRRRRAGKVIIGEVAAEVGAEVIEVEVGWAGQGPVLPPALYGVPPLAAVAGAVEPVVGCVHGRRSAPGGRPSIRGELEGGVVRGAGLASGQRTRRP